VRVFRVRVKTFSKLEKLQLALHRHLRQA